MSSQHPVLAVVDEQQERTVVWHVQTAPGMAEGSGKLSGAWVLSEEAGDVDPAQLEGILEGTRVVSAEEPHLEAFVEALREAITELKEYRIPAGSQKKTPSAPRFSTPTEPDLNKIAEAYHGEPVGRRAWTVATALAELVSTWHDIERQRRGRKYLKEAFGPDIRALPVPR
ncbi:hypothetical protein L1O03_00330 [Corynebacterium uropygiale]|uniref:Uncharacterized protein n=1 Tax=Corynebacterium uropygiale TaxID=1775911 RepID=A0A9X1QLV3_9CORY|nr:hypothetical protein [Corynebacterium uropygiale]MCF4005634.1 hypothetical protein [Corynebacterium uropygiale]